MLLLLKTKDHSGIPKKTTKLKNYYKKEFFFPGRADMAPAATTAAATVAGDAIAKNEGFFFRYRLSENIHHL